MKGSMNADTEYILVGAMSPSTLRHNRRVFLLRLKRKPVAAVAVVVMLMAVGVGLAALSSTRTRLAWNPELAWLPALGAIFFAAYLAAALYLVRERAEVEIGSEETEEDNVSIAGEAGARLTAAVTGPVVMLDIDGTLHTGQSGTLSKLPLLQEWLRLHTSVQVVVSSDWRYTHSFDEVRSRFDEDLQSRVIGSTPIIEGAPREREILAVVERFGIKVWAALDDVAEGFPTTAAAHLVLTDPRFGLVRSDLVLLTQRMGL